MTTESRPPFFERLKQGLSEAIQHERGELHLNSAEIPEPPPDTSIGPDREEQWMIITNRLAEFRNYEDGWDGQQAKGPSPTLLGGAIEFLQEFRSAGWPAPTSVVPEVVGTITITWRNGPEYYEVEILGPGHADYTRLRPNA